MIEAMKQALEALEEPKEHIAKHQRLEAIHALRQAIAEAEQKPVAYAVYHRIGGSKTLHWPEQHSENGDAKQYELVPLYSHPPQREWVGLTENEAFSCRGRDYFETYKAIEAKLKEKNGYAEEKNK